MGNPITMMKHLGLGAGMMYLFDPDRGRSRRARLANRMQGTVNALCGTLDEGMRDLRNRAYGTMAEARSRFATDEADDQVIVERVRSKMGRWVSRPRAITVRSREGIVTLSGPILRSEADRLLEVTSCVRGVREVIDQLEVHETPGGHPSLQGGVVRPGERSEFGQKNWSPATKLMLGTAGAVAGLALVRRSGLMIPALALTGAAWALSRAEGDPLDHLSELASRWKGSDDHGHGGPVAETPTAQQGSMI